MVSVLSYLAYYIYGSAGPFLLIESTDSMIASWHCHIVNGDIQSMVLGPDISRTKSDMGLWVSSHPVFVAWADVFVI